MPGPGPADTVPPARHAACRKERHGSPPAGFRLLEGDLVAVIKWCSDRSSPMQRFLSEPSVPARRKSLRRPVSARSFLPTAKLRQLHSPERVAAGSPSHQPPRPPAQRSAQRQSQDTPPAPPAGLGPLGPEATRPAPPPATAQRPEATLRAFRSPPGRICPIVRGGTAAVCCRCDNKPFIPQTTIFMQQQFPASDKNQHGSSSGSNPRPISAQYGNPGRRSFQLPLQTRPSVGRGVLPRRPGARSALHLSSLYFVS